MNKEYRSLREYSRVEAFLPVRIRPVPEEERQNIISRIVIESALTEHPELPQLEDEVLSACLQILNSKLDSIIRLLAFPSNSHKELDFEMVNISAGGLSTSSTEVYAPGDLVEIRLMLPTAPFMIFYVYGNVVKSGNPRAKRMKFVLSLPKLTMISGSRLQNMSSTGSVKFSGKRGANALNVRLNRQRNSYLFGHWRISDGGGQY